MVVAEERKIHRSAVSEGTVITQNATLCLDGAGLEVELDPGRNMATCKHHRQTPAWAAEG